MRCPEMSRSKKYGAPIMVRLYLDDEEEFMRIADGLFLTKSELVRRFVHDALQLKEHLWLYI